MKTKYITMMLVFGLSMASIGVATTSENMANLTKEQPIPFVLYVIGIAIVYAALGMAVNNKEE